MLNNLFGKKITCYNCLAEVRGGKGIVKCQNCNKQINALYIEHYHNSPPLCLQIIGKSSAGKTAYITVLSALLTKMAKYWDRYDSQALVPETGELMRRAARVVTLKELEDATEIEEVLPTYVLELADMPRWGNRSLIIRDVAGEVILKPENFDWTIDKDKAPYILSAPTSLLLLDLEELNRSDSDFDKDLGQTLQRLVQNYVATLTENRMSPIKYPRNMVVVLTQADKVKNKLPENLNNYIFNDTTWENAHEFNKLTEKWDDAFMREYIDTLENVSEAIKDWISNDAGVLGAIRTAERNRLKLKFSIISSTGAPVVEKEVETGVIKACRIQDPLFWALELSSK